MKIYKVMTIKTPRGDINDQEYDSLLVKYVLFSSIIGLEKKGDYVFLRQKELILSELGCSVLNCLGYDPRIIRFDRFADSNHGEEKFENFVRKELLRTELTGFGVITFSTNIKVSLQRLLTLERVVTREEIRLYDVLEGSVDSPGILNPFRDKTFVFPLEWKKEMEENIPIIFSEEEKNNGRLIGKIMRKYIKKDLCEYTI